MQILIIDNSVQIIERFQQFFTETDTVVKCFGAVSYKDGIRSFNTIKPDMVLLDMNLPDKTSYRLLSELKKSDYKTCLIALSIHIDSYTQQQCSLSGADYFFDKYFAYEKIPGVINSLTILKKGEAINAE
jgi:two-component system, NtrC family, response regulator AtoC